MTSNYFNRIESTSDLINYTLRSLGGGMLTVNVTSDQIQDRLFDSLEYFGKYHKDGFESTYESITLEENKSEYELDEKIINVINVMGKTDFNYLDDPTLNFNFQLYEDRLVTGQLDLIGWRIVQEKLRLLEVMLKSKDIFDFNFAKHIIKFHNIEIGEKLKIISVYKIIDYEEYSTILNNEWLKNYFRALLRIQWGENLTKFINISMPGGATLNGEKILQQGLEEKEKLELKIKEEFEEPIDFFLA